MAYGPKRPDAIFLVDTFEKEIVWNGITIILRLNKNGCEGRIYGGFMNHLEIQTKNNEPLPITETGYKSHFFISNCLYKSVTDTFLDLLEEASKSKKWQRYWKEHQEALQQPDLFANL